MPKLSRKLVLSSVFSLMLLAGCQAPMTAPTTPAGVAAEGGYGLLGAKGNPNGKQQAGASAGAAQADCLVQGYAVFALDELSLTGSRQTIEGDAHTNGQLWVRGNQQAITGVAEAVGGFSIQGNRHAIDRQVKSAAEGWPVAVDAGDFTPTFRFQGNVDLNSQPQVWASKGVLKPGVYFSTGTITVSGKDVRGTVTFVAKAVHFAGNSSQLEPYERGALAVADSVQISGAGGTYRGLIAAKQGEFRMTGNENTVRGLVMAQDVFVAGSVNTIGFEDHGYCEPPEPSAKPDPAPTPEPSGSPEPTPEPSASPEPSPEPSASPEPTPEPSASPTEAPTPTPEPTASPTPTPDGSAGPTPTPAPTPTPKPTHNPDGGWG